MFSRPKRRDFLRAAAAGALVSARGSGAEAYRSAASGSIPFERADLWSSKLRRFRGARLREIAFPLGGIGTGSVSVGGRGELRDWEIFNRPNLGGTLPFSFVAIWAKEPGGSPVARIAESRLLPPYGNTQGPTRLSAIGLPHFEDAEFRGEFPFAWIDLREQAFPLDVTLEAFSPFIPLEADDSALPVAVLRYTLKSRSSKPIEGSLAFSLFNPVGRTPELDKTTRINRKIKDLGKNVNERIVGGPFEGILLRSEKFPRNDVRTGSMAVLTDAREASWLSRWNQEGRAHVGQRFDDLDLWWQEYSATGQFADPSFAGPSADQESDACTLAPKFTVAPGGSATVTFVLAWHFPLFENYWNREPAYHGKVFRNRYAARFDDARAVAEYTLANMPRLHGMTRKFHDSLFGSTLPAVVLDAASSQASTLRTPTCLYFDNGQFHGFEGCGDQAGWGSLNCTHVWNYEQTLAHLFPALERTVRETDFVHNVREDGSMAFRTLAPLGKPLWEWERAHAAADGQMGCIVRAYREWELSGDVEFLKRIWPNLKRALEYAWTSWDADKDGVMEGVQHNTYDIDFVGANTMTGALYLAALRAGSKLAAVMGDPVAAAQFGDMFDQGAAKLDQSCWNGEYYIQKVDLAKAPGQQYGAGCLSDQLLGQWAANIAGLGYVLPREHVRTALRSIYRHNFHADLRKFPNARRMYALGDEKALIMCSWPKGGRPHAPFDYCDEVWSGVEYEVAAMLFHEGMLDEGLAIVKAVRDRHDGERRNPWNEFEFGNHYARAMASWSLIPALSGFHYSAADKLVWFVPRISQAAFRCFFSTSSGWGTVTQDESAGSTRIGFEVAHGHLTLAELFLTANLAGGAISTNRVGVSASRSKEGEGRIRLSETVFVPAGARFELRLGR